MKSLVLRILATGFLLIAYTSVSKAETYKDLDPIVTNIAQLVRDQLVDENTANKTADEILRRLSAGNYASINSSEMLEQRITDDLRAISGDTHIGIVLDPDSVARYRARDNAEQSE